MKFINILVLALSVCLLSSCGIEASEDDPGEPGEPDKVPYQNVSSSNLPLDRLSGNSMDAQAVDIDQDGDMDLVIAVEFGANKLLLNNSSGVFNDAPAGQLPSFNYNSKAVAVADFNNDGFFDIFFANAASQTSQQINEFYLNQRNTTFLDRSDLIPVIGISNSAKAQDINNDQRIDLIIGNNGQNVILINSGTARLFFNDTGQRLPQQLNQTSDIEIGDISGDGAPDIIVANEDDVNRILFNTDSGFFVDQTDTRLPSIEAIEETREVDLGDVDDDGDLDIYFSNAQLFRATANAEDRLLINNGQGVFTDVTSSQLPQESANTVDSDFVDIDGDGDLDILTGNFSGGARVFINNGSGTFADSTEKWLPENFNPRVVDFEVADYNGDGLPDIYIANYQSADVLLIRRDQ